MNQPVTDNFVDLKSSAQKQGKQVTQIIHFDNSDKKTITGIQTETIKQSQFTQFATEDGRLIYINDKKVNMIEVFTEK